MRQIIFTGLALLLLSSPATAEIKQIRFLGWSQNSKEMAYQLTEVDKQKKTQRQTVIKALTKKMRLKSKKLGKTTPQNYLKFYGFKVEPLTATAQSKYVTLFTRGTRQVARFELLIGRKLAYRLSIKTRKKKWKMIRKGSFKDIFTDIKALAYVSPDGIKVTVVLHKRTPYKIEDTLMVVIARH